MLPRRRRSRSATRATSGATIRARAAAAKEPPADLARAGLSAAQAEELGKALLELKLALAQEGETNAKLKIRRSGRQVIITAT